MKTRYAFTMLELIFVIVIMGIIGKFGIEFLANAYRSFIFAKINHTLQSNSSTAVELIASRLQYRIKDSIIGRKKPPNANLFLPLGSINTTLTDIQRQEYSILEWVGSDIDGFRGFDSNSSWSGIADIDASLANTLNSPASNTTDLNNLIGILSASGSTLDDAALYFIGSNSDIRTGYGWDTNTTAINTQNGAIHPIFHNPGTLDEFYPDNTNFTSISEYYKLAWTAYALVLDDGNLTLHYDYQPWQDNDNDNVSDETYLNGKTALLMENVDTFQFMAIGSIVKVQVCVKSAIIDGNSNGGYSVCKEKTIY